MAAQKAPSDLQFAILDSMADDAENIEQVYLAANRETLDGERFGNKMWIFRDN